MAALLRETVRRAKPEPIAPSLRAAIPKLMSHWMRQRLRRQKVIHPGMAKMARWGECKERQARENCRTLERWGVLVPTDYARGGRRATRFEVSGEALFQALLLCGCNPSPALRDGLRRFDLVNDLSANARNPAPDTGKTTPDQSLSTFRKIRNSGPPEDEANPAGNPAENPALSAAGIHRESQDLGHEATVVPFPASPGRSADAPLSVFSFHSQTGHCRTAGRDDRPKRQRNEAFRQFLRVYPKRANVDRARKAFEEAISSGVPAETILHGAMVYAKLMADEDPVWITCPTTWLTHRRWEDADPDDLADIAAAASCHR